MNQNEYIQRVFYEIATEATAQHTNPWRRIASKINRKNDPKLAYSSRRKRLLLVLLTILILAGVASCVYIRFLMIDPGLQGVENNGMVRHPNQTAMPTVFRTLPADLGPSKTSPVSLKLDWAYADEIRFAMQFTLTGISIPEGENFSDFICEPQITNQQHVLLNKPGLDWVPLKGTAGYQLTYISYQKFDASQVDHLDIDLDLMIGPCSPLWNFQETNLGAQTPVPLIGNYHLAFRVPVYQGRTIRSNPSKTANGITVHLEQITVEPSFLHLFVCYQPPNNSWVEDQDSWMVNDATIQVDGKEPISMVPVALPETSATKSTQHCEHIGFPVASIQKPDTIRITITGLSAHVGEDSLLLPKYQEYARDQLAPQGIELSFTPAGDHFYEIVKKPAGMSEDKVRTLVEEILTQTVNGPWVFSIGEGF